MVISPIYPKNIQRYKQGKSASKWDYQQVYSAIIAVLAKKSRIREGVACTFLIHMHEISTAQ